MKRLSDLQDLTQKKQKTSSSSRVEVSTYGEKRISETNSITTSSTSLNFMNVCTIPEVLDSLVNVRINSILILACTNKFFNERIFKMALLHLMKLYESRLDSLTTRIFDFDKNTLSDAVAFYICALKTILQYKANSSLESEQIYQTCEQFVINFDENFNESFDEVFDASFGADAIKMKFILQSLLEMKTNAKEDEKIFCAELTKTFIAIKFADRFLNADRSLNTCWLISRLQNYHWGFYLIPLVIQFNGIRTVINQLKDLLVGTSILFEEKKDKLGDILDLVRTLVTYKSPKNFYEYLTIDFLESTIALLNKIHSEITKLNPLIHHERTKLNYLYDSYKIIEIITSYISQKEPLDDNELNSLLNVKQCCFNLLEILPKSALQKSSNFQALILEILINIAQQSNACTEDEFLFIGQIFKNWFDHYNSDSNSNFNSLFDLLTRFSDVFAYENFTDPNHITEYVNLSFNFVLEIFRRPTTAAHFFKHCYRIIHPLLKHRSFLDAVNFIEFKNIMLKIFTFRSDLRSDYVSFLIWLIEHDLIKIEVHDLESIASQILDINLYSPLPDSVPNLIILLLCNRKNLEHFYLFIPVIMVILQEQDYLYLKNELMTNLKNHSVQVDATTSLLLTIHNKKPIFDQSELDFLLSKK